MRATDIAYSVGGKTFIGHLVVDEALAGRRPGVLIGPEATGLSDVTRSFARRLAEAGYAAFAFDFHGAGAVLPLEEARAAIHPYITDVQSIRELSAAALEVLKAQPETDASRLAAIGYCFGGQAVLELARAGAALTAVVGFHSALVTPNPQDAKNIKGKVLVQIGSQDRIVPLEQRTAFGAEMEAAGVDWRLITYGGVGHSFTNPQAHLLQRPNVAFDADAERRSWAAMMDLFDEVF